MPNPGPGGLVMEGTTLRSTLSSLEQSLASRSKQISHLQEPFEAGRAECRCRVFTAETSRKERKV